MKFSIVALVSCLSLASAAPMELNADVVDAYLQSLNTDYKFPKFPKLGGLGGHKLPGGLGGLKGFKLPGGLASLGGAGGLSSLGGLGGVGGLGALTGGGSDSGSDAGPSEDKPADDMGSM